MKGEKKWKQYSVLVAISNRNISSRIIPLSLRIFLQLNLMSPSG